MSHRVWKLEKVSDPDQKCPFMIVFKRVAILSQKRVLRVPACRPRIVGARSDELPREARERKVYPLVSQASPPLVPWG